MMALKFCDAGIGAYRNTVSDSLFHDARDCVAVKCSIMILQRKLSC
jgi:hypothetical protein